MPSSPHETVIPHCKIKLLLLSLGALLFMAMGCWFISLDPSTLGVLKCRHHSTCVLRQIPYGLQFFGGFIILFFGPAGLFAFKMLFNNQAGLILNSKGITDHSAVISAGFIPWSDISGFRTIETKNHKSLMIQLQNSTPYIHSGNWIQRFWRGINYRQYGSPFFVCLISLKIKFKDLVALCQEYFETYGQRSSDSQL